MTYLVPICQYNQCCQYGSENVRLLYGRGNIEETGQNQGRYPQGKISVSLGRKSVGTSLRKEKMEVVVKRW